MKLKHIVGYLPYGLKFISELDGPYEEMKQNPIWTLNGIFFLFGDYCLNNIETSDAYTLHLCKPILRPLSDLTKEIEVDGEKFVPIVELCKIHEIEFIDGLFNDPFTSLFSAEWLPYAVIQKLYQWHFDIHSLINQNKAIDINQINRNYEKGNRNDGN